MSTVYTKRLAALRVSAATNDQVVYTNTESGVVVVRSIVLANLHSAAQTIGIFLPVTGGSAWMIRDLAVPAGGTIAIDIRQQLLSGEQLHFQAAAGPASVLITGYVFS